MFLFGFLRAFFSGVSTFFQGFSSLFEDSFEKAQNEFDFGIIQHGKGVGKLGTVRNQTYGRKSIEPLHILIDDSWQPLIDIFAENTRLTKKQFQSSGKPKTNDRIFFTKLTEAPWPYDPFDHKLGSAKQIPISPSSAIPESDTEMGRGIGTLLCGTTGKLDLWVQFDRDFGTQNLLYIDICNEFESHSGGDSLSAQDLILFSGISRSVIPEHKWECQGVFILDR